MPTVPTYDAPRVSSTALRAPAAGPNTAGMTDESLGKGLANAGADLDQIIRNQQADINEANLKDQDNALQAGQRTILHDPASGYLNMLGKDAVNTHQATVEALTSLPDTFTQYLNNPVQRQMWANVSQQRTQAALNAVDEHAATQTKAYNIGQTTARIEAQKPDMALNADAADPAQARLYGMAKATALGEIDNLGELKGMSADEVAQAKQTFLTGAHQQAVEHLLSEQNYAGAKAYFADNVGEILPPAQDKIREQLKTAGVKDESLRIALQLKSAGDYQAQTHANDDAYNAGQITADVHDAVSVRLDHDEQVRKAQLETATKADVATAQDFLLHNKDKSVLDLDAPLYQRLLSTGQIPALEAFSRRDVPSKPAVWFDAANHIGDGSAQDIAQMSDSEWYKQRADLSDADFKRFTTARTNIQQGKASTDPANIDMPTFRTAVKNSLSGIGISSSVSINGSPADKDRLGGIMQYAADWVRKDQLAAGRKFNQEEITDSVNRLFVKDVDFKKSHLFGLWTTPTSQKMMTMRSTDLPSGVREGIVAGLARAGVKNPSDRDIMMQYWRVSGAQ